MRQFLFLLLVAAIFPIPESSAARVDSKKVARWQERKNKERKLFAAKESTEAIVTFTHDVELVSARKPSKDKALAQIDEQLWHLFGPLSVVDLYAAPKGNHRVTGVTIKEKEDSSPRTWVISYTYKGTMQVKKGKKEDFFITLPVNPSLIFEQAKVGSKAPCTDDHYPTKDDFWYFWNPDNDGCKKEDGGKLVEDVHYRVFNADKLERIANTTDTRPNYDALPDQDGKVRISILMGLDEPKNNATNRNPLKSNDINAETYVAIRDRLRSRSLGFKSTSENEDPWSEEELGAIIPNIGKLKYPPYVETFEKTAARKVKTKSGEMKNVVISVRLFFGPTGITEDGNRAFHSFYKDSLENDSVVIYDGHSGLGGHLDIESIEANLGESIKIPKSRYQIYFVNSCTSYTYYNLAYFERKAKSGDPEGIKHLEILVNGLATDFDALKETNLDLIKAINAWAENRKPLTSYQALATSVDTSNLFSVNGDEDEDNKM